MLIYPQQDPVRRLIHGGLTLGALLFIASGLVIYEFQVLGYGAIIRSLIMNAFSPVWWAMVLVFIHACIQLFRYYDPNQRRQTLDRFFRNHAVLYALTFGLFCGYVGGSLDRFLDSRRIMACGNSLHAELARQMQEQGTYSADQLRQSEAYQAALDKGLRVQLLQPGQSLVHIIDADLTLYVGPQEFSVIVPYDLPIFLISDMGESRIFQRHHSDAHWSKQYLKPGPGHRYEIVDKA